MLPTLDRWLGTHPPGSALHTNCTRGKEAPFPPFPALRDGPGSHSSIFVRHAAQRKSRKCLALFHAAFDAAPLTLPGPAGPRGRAPPAIVTCPTSWFYGP